MRIPFRQYWNLLVRYLVPQRWRAVWLAVLVLGSIALQIINPQIMRAFIDAAQGAAQPGKHSVPLLRLALAFIAIAVVQQGVGVLATYVSESVGWSATNALRGDLAERCLRADMAFLNTHTPGEMIERIDGDVTALSNFFSQFVIQVLGNLVLLVGVIVMLFREGWQVGVVLAAFAVLGMAVLGRLANVAVPHWEAERQASADLFGFLEERLAGTEDIRASGAKAYVLRRFFELQRVQMRRTLKAGWMINKLIVTIDLLFTLGMAAGFAVGAYLFRAQTLSIGSVYLVFYYSTMLMMPIVRITMQVQDLQRAGASIERVQALFAVQPTIETPIERSTDTAPGGDGATARLHGARALGVEFEDVSFGYTSAEAGAAPVDAAGSTVLHGLTFRLQPGAVLGLLGRTGSGKTTLTRLLFRLYDPDRGTIRLGDGGALADIRTLPLTGLRRAIAMVTQNVQLFHASVRDNLTFFDPSIPDQRILQVIEELGLGAWYRALPAGLDTDLASGGGGLSAGEAQLLAFVRVFLHDPGLVVLDEASSRLDPATERLIERAVERLVQGRTAIIIAHRLATVQRSDEIMVLESGRIVEHGQRVALANDPGSRFYHLLQTGLEEVLA